MWNPTSCTHNTMPSASNSPAPQTGPAIIDNEVKAPPCPAHMPLAHPSQPALVQDDNDAPPIASRPRTHAKLQTWAEVHLIITVIQDDLMPNCSLTIKPHKLHHGYSQATQAILVQIYVLGTNSTCFISTIIDDNTGNTLKYCQLIKIPKYWDIWTQSCQSTWLIVPIPLQAQRCQHLLLYQEFLCP